LRMCITGVTHYYFFVSHRSLLFQLVTSEVRTISWF
jgi:hypothetical protein